MKTAAHKSHIKAVPPAADEFCKKKTFFLQLKYLRAPMDFFHEIFLKPNLRIEICRLRVFLRFQDHKRKSKKIHQVGDLQKTGFQNRKSSFLLRKFT